MRERHFNIAAFVLLAFSTAPCWAALGEKASSINSDNVRLRAAHTTTKISALFSVHEATLGGRTVRQYISNATNTVFAIRWTGNKCPDLHVLLGRSFEEYDSIQKNLPRVHSRAPLAISGSNFTVKRIDRPRLAIGLAYTIPLPEGLSESDLQ